MKVSFISRTSSRQSLSVSLMVSSSSGKGGRRRRREDEEVRRGRGLSPALIT
jgi:hypothetical protein